MAYCAQCESIYNQLIGKKTKKGVIQLKYPNANFLILLKKDFLFSTSPGEHLEVRYTKYHSLSGNFDQPLESNRDVIVVIDKYTVGIACQALTEVFAVTN